jgi:hypothetical protein
MTFKIKKGHFYLQNLGDFDRVAWKKIRSPSDDPVDTPDNTEVFKVPEMWIVDDETPEQIHMKCR